MDNVAIKEGVRQLFYDYDEDDTRTFTAIEKFAETQGNEPIVKP